MKTMKKVFVSICSFIFLLAVSFGITFSTGVTAKADTSANVSIDYACVEYSKTDGTGVPTTYTFVAGLTTPNKYDTYVYFNGEQVAAQVHDGNFYVDHSAYNIEVGDMVLLEIPAGTYYQSNAYVANDVKVFITLTNSYTNPDSGAYNKQGIFDRVNADKIISEEAYAIELYKVDWAMNANSQTDLYLRIVDPNHDIKSGTNTDWSGHAKYSPLGKSLTLNGTPVNSTIQKVYADGSEHCEAAYMTFAGVTKPGDVLTFDGWFYNANMGAFRIENTSFVYDGKSWDEANAGTYSFEVSTTSDANPQNGFYLSMVPNHIPVSTESSGWSFSTIPTGSKSYGTYNGVAKEIRFRKFSATDWYVGLNETGITAVAGDVVSFGGWYRCNDGIKNYFIKFNQAEYRFDGSKWTETTPTYTVALKGAVVEGDYIYVTPGQSITDVSATASNGGLVTMNFVDGAKDGKFVLRSGESSSEYLATFSVSGASGVIFRKQMVVRVGFEDFVMENGAAVRVVGDNVNGLRFSAEMSKTTYSNLAAQNATFGMVIVPRDYITDGYELTAANLFGSNAKYSVSAAAGASQSVRRMLLLNNLTPEDNDGDGNYEIYGSITDILTNNLTREFVGVAYVCVNGEYIVATYYAGDIENNARSIYYVSQRAIDANDNVAAVQTKYIDAFGAYVEGLGATYDVEYTINYIKTRKGSTEIETETFTAPLNEVVEIAAKDYDGFQLNSFVSNVSLKLYANKANVFDFYYKDTSLPSFDMTAWHHPDLDESNNYMNETNKAIAETMSAAGFTSVMLNGSHTVGDVYLNSPTNIATMKNIINMFWTYGGITTYVSGKNAGNSIEYVSLENYKELQAEMATLLDCDGFGGFFAWDEPVPTQAAMDRLAEYAEWFVSVYGADAMFMVNLLPSYYSEWSSGDYKSYSAYVKAYCDIVLSQVTEGTKYLSMDSYPVYADGSLMKNYMYDLAVLKHYALEYGAQANAILQACGWSSSNNNKVPTEEQYRLMYYTALAFGADSIGWWGYSPEGENPTVILPDQTPVDINNNTTAAYDALKEVNTEVAGFGSLYKTYNWQGVIMSSPSQGFFGIGKDAQYDAFNMVKSDSLLSKYMLSASNTSSFSSISGSGSNYVIGVMKDDNNNEAFTVVNYSAPKDNKTLTLTLKAKVNGEYTIYQNGEQKTVSITTGGYTLTLAPGEGAFIVSANTVHTVTFKNWDGTVLYETTGLIGTTPEYVGATPVKDGHEFAGWTPAIGAITGDTVYTATFKGMPTITFKNWDGTVLQQSTWAYGATPVYSGATPTKPGCDFAGWTPAITMVTGDAVYTATFIEQYTVTMLNADGTNAVVEQEVFGGDIINYTPTLSGYIFKGWLLDGEAYDASTPVTSDVTLVASWYKKLDNGEKSVLSAEYIYNNMQFETGYVYQQNGVSNNPNMGWYFDSDYNGYTGAGAADANKFAQLASFALTVDGGAGSDANGRATYIVLPAINYSLYSKVDFVYQNKGAMKSVDIYGVNVSQYGGNNKMISIRTDENGTKLYFAEINSAGTADFPQTVVQLPANVVNGQVGLKIDFTVTAWVELLVTEFHVTKGADDYMASMQDAIAQLESDPSNQAALEAYHTAVAKMTEYERVNHVVPDAIVMAEETALYNAVLEAANASSEQIAAIEAYRAFVATLDESLRNEEHIALINAIIYANYYELEEEEILLNDPVVDTSRGAIDQNERIQSGWGGHSTNYNTTYETYVHMIQFTSGEYDGTATLPAINYNGLAEAYFGVRAITADGIGTVTILGQSFSFNNSKDHNWKITIAGGLLIMADDSKNNNDGGGVIFTAILPEDVANGTRGLVIDFNFEAWSQAEITEMHVTALKVNTAVVKNVISIITGGNQKGEMNVTHAQNVNSKFNGTKYESFSYRQNSSNTDITFTLGTFDYAAYDEVRFAVAFAVTGGVGRMSIGGQYMDVPNSLVGHFYKMEAVIVDGYLTMIDFGSSNDVKANAIGYATNGYFFRVKLSDDVLNGLAALQIAFEIPAAYGWFEVTEMHATSTVAIKMQSIISNVVASATVGGEPNVPAIEESACKFKGKVETFSYMTGNPNVPAIFTLNKLNYASYDEVSFYVAMAVTGDRGVINVCGQTYSIPSSLIGHWYYMQAIIKDGYLILVDAGSTDDVKTRDTNYSQYGYFFKVALPENVLNGSEALTIGVETSPSYMWFEVTEMATVKTVKPIV